MQKLKVKSQNYGVVIDNHPARDILFENKTPSETGGSPRLFEKSYQMVSPTPASAGRMETTGQQAGGSSFLPFDLCLLIFAQTRRLSK